MLLKLLHRLICADSTHRVDFIRMVQERLESSSLLIFPPESVPSAWDPLILTGQSLRRIIKRCWILNIFLESIYCVLFASESMNLIGSCTNRLIIVVIHHPPRVPNIIFFKFNIFYSLPVAHVFVLYRIMSHKPLLVRKLQIFDVTKRLQNCVQLVWSVSYLYHAGVSWISFFDIIFLVSACWCLEPLNIWWILINTCCPFKLWVWLYKLLSSLNKWLLGTSQSHHVNIG